MGSDFLFQSLVSSEHKACCWLSGYQISLETWSAISRFLIINNKNMDYTQIKQLEEQWWASQKKYSDKELLEIFPEAKNIVSQKISEYKREKKIIIEELTKLLIFIRERTGNEFMLWFWREWLKINLGEKLLTIDEYINRFKILYVTSIDHRINRRITEDKIQMALSVPIEKLINKPLRKSGKNLVGLCPLHNDKNPSFYIYPKTNSFYCFGCQKGGNVIIFTRLLYGYSFKEAVEHLVGEK